MLTREQARDATQTIVEFCRFVRHRGIAAGVQDCLACLQAAAAIGFNNPEELKCALRATLCASKDEWDIFEECFLAFWVAKADVTGQSSTTSSAPAVSIEGASRAMLMSTGMSGKEPSRDDGALAVTGASSRERLTTADFSTLPRTDLAALEQIALRLFKQMGRRLARRRRISATQGMVDLRRTIHRNVHHGGEPISLRYRERKPRPQRLITLLDISGSMSAYSLFLLKFLYALQRHFRRADTFLFSTGLVEITQQFRLHRLDDALYALSQQRAGWSGGTKIGGSLCEFNRSHRTTIRSSDTVFLILSDGWDTGDPADLSGELRALKRRVRKLIWLNPLLGSEDYQPLTRGMSAALPYIDVFAPAHNLESLLALEKHL
jgi:uncharacterized protein with von Willebrand factor type A (vWA) domain